MEPTHYTGMADIKTLFHCDKFDRWFIHLGAAGWKRINYVPKCTPVGEIEEIEISAYVPPSNNVVAFNPYEGAGRYKGD